MTKVHRARKVLLVLGALLSLSLRPAFAGSPDQHEGHQMAPARPAVAAAPAPNAEKVLGWEPIRCWRQTSAGAISIGEAFTVVVTCAVYEGDNAQVVPDESRLNVAAIQLAPFEILGGSHPPDVHRGTRRFFQYDYQLRIISPDAMGHDVNVPPLPISYRIHSRVGAAATLEGRDLSYLLPMMPIKILSLVPNDASDIRDASEASLGAVDSLRFRSSLFRVLTMVFGALAAVMIVLALVPMARTSVTAKSDAPDRVPDGRVVDSAMAALAKVQEKAKVDGWNNDHLADALSAVRLIAAAAINQPNSQKPLGKDGVASEGRMHVQSGVVRTLAMAASSSVTPVDVANARRRATGFSTTRLQQLEGLQSSLETLTAAQYRKEPVRDSSTIDGAVDVAIAVGRDVKSERNSWSTRWARR